MSRLFANRLGNPFIEASTFTTKGDIMGTSAADTIGRLAVGTNDQVLTADSAEALGIKWAASGGGGGAWTLVEGQTISGSPTEVDFETDMGTYETHMFIGQQVLVTTDGDLLYVRLKVAAAYATSGYRRVIAVTRSGGTGPTLSSSNSSDHIRLISQGLSSDSDHGIDFVLILNNANDTAKDPTVSFWGSGYVTNSDIESFNGGGSYDTADDVEGVRFFPHTVSNTLASGRIIHLGAD